MNRKIYILLFASIVGIFLYTPSLTLASDANIPAFDQLAFLGFDWDPPWRDTRPPVPEPPTPAPEPRWDPPWRESPPPAPETQTGTSDPLTPAPAPEPEPYYELIGWDSTPVFPVPVSRRRGGAECPIDPHCLSYGAITSLVPDQFELGTVSEVMAFYKYGSVNSCGNITFEMQIDTFLDGKIISTKLYPIMRSGQYVDSEPISVVGLLVGTHRVDMVFTDLGTNLKQTNYKYFLITSGSKKTCEELGNCPPKTCEELGTCPPDESFNYSLSNSGESRATKTSSNAITTNTITKNLIAGSGSVTITATGMPSGVSITYDGNRTSSLPCSQPTCTAVITFTVPPTAVNGTYPITVTGSPLNKQTSFNLVVSGDPFSVSCAASPRTALINETVTWTATVSGGTSPKTYVWSGTNIPTSPAPTTNPYSITYGTIGQKTATVTVTGANLAQATCPTNTVQINFNPSLEEF